MVEIPEAEVIAGLELMLRETKAGTAVMVKLLEGLKAEQVNIHTLLIEQARASCEVLDEARRLNATAFEASPRDRERRLRSLVDDAFREQQTVLKELQRLPPK